ncbi:MAG TPA: hypothetical protein VMC02_08985, partial [Steroidobacteraceae bacterium]|nr:hypothetical protein [Steroidobacteraceae bacterium]
VESRRGFLILDQNFKSGDVIVLTLPMPLRVSQWPNDGIGIERGPLVYALPIEATWTSFAESAYSSEEVPTWEANPVGVWNYGLVLDSSNPDATITVIRKPAAQSVERSNWPWNDAPLVLSVPARRLEGWDYRTNPGEPHQRFTPHLPGPEALKSAGPVEHLTLVPYGATQLRMAIFPTLGGNVEAPREKS